MVRAWRVRSGDGLSDFQGQEEDTAVLGVSAGGVGREESVSRRSCEARGQGRGANRRNQTGGGRASGADEVRRGGAGTAGCHKDVGRTAAWLYDLTPTHTARVYSRIILAMLEIGISFGHT